MPDPAASVPWTERKFDVFWPIKKYYDTIGSNNLLDTLITSSALAGAGYWLAPKVVKGLYKMTGGSDRDAADKEKELAENPDEMVSFRRRAAFGGALAGIAWGLTKHWMDPGKPAGADTNPLLPQKTAASWNNLEDFDDNLLVAGHHYYEPFDKTKAIGAFQRDPILLGSTKSQLYQLLDKSSPQRPTTTGFNLTNAAVNAGVGFGTAWLFGQGIGKIMALPTRITDRLSMAGGITAAVLDSGILREL